MLLLKRFGINLLTKQQTEDYLQPYLIKVNSQTRIRLPGVENYSDSTKFVFKQTEALTHQSYVWDYKPTPKRTRQLLYGSILTDTHVLCTDFESYHIKKNFLTARKRTISQQKIVIAPWSHYLDGITFGGYYDFVILVAAKLCRIKDVLPDDVFAEAVVSYPLFKTAYEQDYLSLLGFSPDRIFDSRVDEVRFDRCILSNSGHWFYPHPADISALKKHIENKLDIQRTGQNRIYISRSGRRRVINEADVIVLLKKYNFAIIEDQPRSIAEQVAIYKNASFIIGPHGASFTNILWCEPGTYLLELFSGAMVVDHFRYLAELMGIHYRAYYYGLKLKTVETYSHPLEQNIFVSVADLEKHLTNYLGASTL